MKLTRDDGGGDVLPLAQQDIRCTKTLRIGFDTNTTTTSAVGQLLSPNHPRANDTGNVAVNIGHHYRRRNHSGGDGNRYPEMSQTFDYRPDGEPLDPLIPADRDTAFHRSSSSPGMYWKYLIIAQGLAIIGLAVGLILISLAHDGHTHARDAPSTERTRKLPTIARNGIISAELMPPPPPAVYKFKMTAVFAQYPQDGATIPGLGVDGAQTARCCCTYKVMAKSYREVRVCTDSGDGANPDLEFYLKPDKNAMGSHLIVTGSRDMLGAQCALTWK